jgi:hypothetical protein
MRASSSPPPWEEESLSQERCHQTLPHAGLGQGGSLSTDKINSALYSKAFKHERSNLSSFMAAGDGREAVLLNNLEVRQERSFS